LPHLFDAFGFRAARLFPALPLKPSGLLHRAYS
jgi:hypothetical protein